jgi:UDP-glucuronate 4-epimerase
LALFFLQIQVRFAFGYRIRWDGVPEVRFFMDVQRILVTGGAGFIGSHLSEALLRKKVQLSIVDNLDDFYDPMWKRANLDEVGRAGQYGFYPVDICDVEAIGKVMRTVRPDVVIHLGARAGVRPSIERPRLYEQVNISGTVNLLEVSREMGVKRFIFGSSSSVYGATSKVPFSEDQVEGRPISPYAASKLAGELFCYTYAHLFGIPTVCLRFFTVFGPRQRPDLAIYRFTEQIEADLPISVFGDGSTGRDYTYVDDIVAGVLAALDFHFPPACVPFEVFNLGNSHPVKLSELLSGLELVLGRKAIRVQKPLQPGDVPMTWADISKATRLLNYRPKVTLDAGLRDFVAWYRGVSARRRP